MARTLVTGGTGTLGSHVVPRLVAAAGSVRVLSRRAGRVVAPDGIEVVGGDLTTGDGVADALAGVDVVVHLAGDEKHNEATTRALVEAVRRAGTTPHLVFVSVVGADAVTLRSRVDEAMFGYMADKHAAEGVVEGSGLPWTTLRATQFHSFVVNFAALLGKLPVVPVPAGWQAQPVAADEVAERLVELALGDPAGRVPDLAGPEILSLRTMVRGYLDAVGKRRPTVPVRVPGRASREYAAGANLAPGRAVGAQTWAQYLDAEVRPRR